jgi:hypothetical protein
VTIINKTGGDVYLSTIDKTVRSKRQTIDLNVADFCTAMRQIVRMCGKACCIRLNGEERLLLKAIQALDADGCKFSVDTSPIKNNSLSKLIADEEKEKAKKIASIVAMRNKSEAIANEATYASREDVSDAEARSRSQLGVVDAKKLDRKSDDPISLNDLMSDNKFIEESMKHSGIPAAVASEEGWDMEAMNKKEELPEEKPEAAAETEAVAEPKAEDPGKSSEEESEGAEPKPRRRRGKRESK